MVPWHNYCSNNNESEKALVFLAATVAPGRDGKWNNLIMIESGNWARQKPG
jgi:hypothetical protein